MTTAQRATADRMLGSKGQAITITRVTEGAYNPATGSATTGTDAQTGAGAVFPYSPGLRNQAGSLIGVNDQQLLLSTLDSDGAVLDPKPAQNDIITLADGSTHTIEAIQTLSPAGIAIMHDCRIRGAV
jgi:hypothetical protein